MDKIAMTITAVKVVASLLMTSPRPPGITLGVAHLGFGGPFE